MAKFFVGDRMIGGLVKREPVKEDYKLTKAEMETIINFSLVDTTMSYYTTIPKDIARAEKLLADYPDEVQVKQRDQYGIEVIVPRSWFRSPLPPRKLDLTDEQKAAIVARFRGSEKASSAQG